MIVYHVCGFKKFNQYQLNGYIKPPVRAWIDIESAERFSKQTGRPIIFRLRFDEKAKKLYGHKGKAVFIDEPYHVTDVIYAHKKRFKEGI